VALELVPRAFAIALLECFDDAAMLAVRHSQAAAVREPVTAIDAQLLADRLVECRKTRIAGGFVQRGVEGQVEGDVGIGIAARRSLVQLCEQRMKRRELLRIDRRGGAASRESSETRADV